MNFAERKPAAERIETASVAQTLPHAAVIADRLVGQVVGRDVDLDRVGGDPQPRGGKEREVVRGAAASCVPGDGAGYALGQLEGAVGPYLLAGVGQLVVEEPGKDLVSVGVGVEACGEVDGRLHLVTQTTVRDVADGGIARGVGDLGATGEQAEVGEHGVGGVEQP